MARKSRLIYPGIPHHAIQRGNNRQEIFLEDGDRHYYLKWMLSLAIDNKVPIIGYKEEKGSHRNASVSRALFIKNTC
jgi:putative transposase